ncbi:MAG: SHOCT domain-containing protein [Phycisphaerae bacterium]|nr:SHOCT domain-containing protein [Phycisphaerae bacterium]
MASLSEIAAKHHFSESAASAALTALRHGRGMAQFNHSELGGSGQWMNGMIMIGSMSDHALKARVASLFADLLQLAQQAETISTPMKPMPPVIGMQFSVPAAWGQPASSGGQNEMRYAYYPIAHRLVVERDGKRTIYDTANIDITGISQQQSSMHAGRPVFNTDHGPIDLYLLKIVHD